MADKIIALSQVKEEVEQIYADMLKRNDHVTLQDITTGLSIRHGLATFVKKENPVKLNKEDINILANHRYFKKTGSRLLLVAAFIVLALATLSNTYSILPIPLAYGGIIVAGVGTAYFYMKGQKVVRDQFRKELGMEN